MFKWLEIALWGALRAVAWILQFVGFAGILFFMIMGVWALAGRLDRP